MFEHKLEIVRLLLVLYLGFTCNSFSLQSLYYEARQVRSIEGHEQALPLYLDILTKNPHDVTAASHIAADSRSIERHNVFGRGGNKVQRLRFIQLLESFGWNCTTIADLVFASDDKKRTKAKLSSAPLFLIPLRAGQRAPSPPECRLGACIQLLLLSVCIEYRQAKYIFGQEFVNLLQELGIAFLSFDRNLLIPYAHIFPITIANNKSIYVATDLHPNVLSRVVCGRDNDNASSISSEGEEGSVMYIGPDSLALVDHWSNLIAPDIKPGDCIVDFGTGSGIQALSLVAKSSGGKANVKCVDRNKRALRITKLNFEFNGFDNPELILGNINEPYATVFESDDDPKLWIDLLSNSVTHIVSNPPFLPVPHNTTILSRYGSFSNGGKTGEDFLESLVHLASDVLDRSDSSATLAIVSEFMNPQIDFDNRLSDFWGERGHADALFLTNELALNATTYAQRRADSSEEQTEWKRHLLEMRINDVSPGFLFLKRRKESCDITTLQKNTNEKLRVHVIHHLVPKTKGGSIWTPTNQNARSFTKINIGKFFR